MQWAERTEDARQQRERDDLARRFRLHNVIKTWCDRLHISPEATAQFVDAKSRLATLRTAQRFYRWLDLAKQLREQRRREAERLQAMITFWTRKLFIAWRETIRESVVSARSKYRLPVHAVAFGCQGFRRIYMVRKSFFFWRAHTRRIGRARRELRETALLSPPKRPFPVL